MNPIVGSILVWVLLLLGAVLVVHEVRSDPPIYRLLVIDTQHRLHLGPSEWRDLGDCRVKAADIRRATGVLYADCVVAEDTI